jgi:hypothetical protein
MMKLIFLHWLSFLFIPMLLHCSRLQPTDDSELTSSPATTSGSSAYIYYFRLFPNSNSGVISGSSITVTVPNGTDLTNLVAGFSYIGSSVTVGAISQVSGITANNFSVPVTYKVTGTTGTVREFTVTVLYERQRPFSTCCEQSDGIAFCCEHFPHHRYFARLLY